MSEKESYLDKLDELSGVVLRILLKGRALEDLQDKLIAKIENDQSQS